MGVCVNVCVNVCACNMASKTSNVSFSVTEGDGEAPHAEGCLVQLCDLNVSACVCVCVSSIPLPCLRAHMRMSCTY